jgi:thiol-disulfide isomerase/thioredoxin
MTPCARQGPIHVSARAAAFAALLVFAAHACARSDGTVEPRPAPAFTHESAQEWINSPPLSLADLRGHVVLIDFWAFECWNCYRSFPWLNDLAARLGPRGLRVVSVHTPEFERERDPARVAAKVREFGLDHPVMLDNDYSYWRALGNRYWPAFYLVDADGRVRAQFVGETHAGDRQATAIEREIERLLQEARG